jgi:hypothetical protein
MADQRTVILVTGSHRSGTTWVGKVLASVPRAVYLQEPFHIDHPNPLVPVRMKHWFQFITEDGESAEKQLFRDAFSLKFRAASVAGGDGWYPWRLAKKLPFLLRSCYLRWSGGYRVIMKDPIALFSAPWLARNFGMRPVVMIRHPAAFVSSLRIKKWFFDFRNFLDQPDLIEQLFPDERPGIEEAASRQFQDIISEGAYLWKLLHKVISKYRREHPDWYFVRHEDISRNPVEGFREMFSALGLPYTAKSDSFIRSTTNSEDDRYILHSTDTGDVNRNSSANVRAWKYRLSEAKVNKIRDVVGSSGSEFYSDAEWLGVPRHPLGAVHGLPFA